MLLCLRGSGRCRNGRRRRGRGGRREQFRRGLFAAELPRRLATSAGLRHLHPEQLPSRVGRARQRLLHDLSVHLPGREGRQRLRYGRSLLQPRICIAYDGMRRMHLPLRAGRRERRLALSRAGRVPIAARSTGSTAFFATLPSGTHERSTMAAPKARLGSLPLLLGARLYQPGWANAPSRVPGVSPGPGGEQVFRFAYATARLLAGCRRRATARGRRSGRRRGRVHRG